MKTALLALLVTFASVSAHALGNAQIVSVSQSGDLMPGPGMEKHVITTSVKISFVSCANFGEKAFDLTLAQKPGKVPALLLTTKPSIDCQSVGQFRELTLTTDEFQILDAVKINQNGKSKKITVEHYFTH